MAKKLKPPIAPRRPPPAAPPEALEDFIRGSEPGALRASEDVRERSGTAGDVSISTHSQMPKAAEMPSKAVEFPKDVPATGATVDAHERLQTSADATDGSPSSVRVKGIVAREGGRIRRRRTIYLPPDLDEKLETWCVAQGREVSHAVAEAIRRMLGDSSN